MLCFLHPGVANCALCRNKDNEEGIDVCLVCFNGGCLDETRNHAAIHAKKFGHSLSINIKRREKPRRVRTIFLPRITQSLIVNVTRTMFFIESMKNAKKTDTSGRPPSVHG